MQSLLLTPPSDHREVSTDLVIEGLTVPTDADLKKMETVVLRVLHPDIEPRDVVSSRLLLKKSTVSDATESITGAVTAPARLGTSRSDTQDTASSSNAVPMNLPRSPSILVVMNSRPLLLEIMQKKLRIGKFHTSALATVLPEGVDIGEITPGLLNINAFLPRVTFDFHREIRVRSRQPNSGFVTFVRDGKIFVRRKKGNVPTRILSMADLDNFLGQ